MDRSTDHTAGRINDDVRARALQVALLVPLVAGLLGVAAALRMRRIPDPEVREGDRTSSADRHDRDRTETRFVARANRRETPG